MNSGATEISQYLPFDEWQAATNSPTQATLANPFVTVADLDGVGDNWADANLAVTANRSHDGATFDMALSNFGDYSVDVNSNFKRTWSSGTNAIAEGIGVNPTGFEGAGGVSSWFTTAGNDAYSGSFGSGGDAWFTSAVYGSGATDESALLIGKSAGSFDTYAQLYHWQYATGAFIGFEANEFGERILSKSVSLGRLDVLGAPNGIAFLSGAGGLGYIGTASQLGMQSWMNAGAIPGGWGGIYEGSGSLGAGTTTVTLPAAGVLTFTGSFAGTLFSIDGNTGKITMDGLLDPSGLQVTPQAANPGSAQTYWSDSTDSNRAYFGANKIAYITDLIPDTDTNIYNTSNTVGAGRVATLTDNITWDGGSNIFKGAGADETNNLIELQTSASLERFRITDDGRMKLQFDGPIDAGNAGRNHVLQFDADVSERTGGDGYSAYQFTSSFEGTNTSNWYRTMFVTAPRGGVNPTTAGGRVAISASANSGVGNPDDVQKAIYTQVGNAVTRQYAIQAHVVQGLASFQNYAVYALLQPGAQGSKTGPASAVYGQGGTSDALYTGTMHGGNFLIATGAQVACTNIGVEAGAIGASATNMAIRVLANRGVLVFGTTNPVVNTMLTLRSIGNDSSTYGMRIATSSGVNNFVVRDDGLSMFHGSAANPMGDQARMMAGEYTTDTDGLEHGISMLMRHAPTVDGSGRPTSAYFRGYKQGGFDSLGLYALVGEAYNVSTGDMTNASIGAVGVFGQFRNTANNAVIQRAFAGDFNAQSSSAVASEATIVSMGALSLRMDQTNNVNITHWQYIYAKAPTNITNPNVTNSYIFRADSADAIGATNNYGMYIAGNNSNRFQGDMVIGSLTQSAGGAGGISTLEVNGDAEVIGVGTGLILEAPDTTRYKVTVNNAGALVIAAA